MLCNYVSECAEKHFVFHQTGFLVMLFIFNSESINKHKFTVHCMYYEKSFHLYLILKDDYIFEYLCVIMEKISCYHLPQLFSYLKSFAVVVVFFMA